MFIAFLCPTTFKKENEVLWLWFLAILDALPEYSQSVLLMGFPGGLAVKNPTCSVEDAGSILGFERSPGRGNGNPLQYSCQENLMDRGAWQAAVPGVSKNQTRLNSWALLGGGIFLITVSAVLPWISYQITVV